MKIEVSSVLNIQLLCRCVISEFSSRPKVINRSDGESFPIVYRSLL